MRITTAAVLALAVLTGCSGGGSTQPSTSASSTPSPTTPSSTTFGLASSLVELRDAATDAGLDCPSWELGLEAPGGMTKAGTCGGGVDLVVHADAEAQELAVDYLVREGDTVLVGPNWTIVTDQAPELAAELGGEVRTSTT